MGTDLQEYDLMCCPKCHLCYELDKTICKECGTKLQRKTISPKGIPRK